MKRIISLLIAAVLLIPPSVMAEEEQQVNSQAVTAAGVLQALGVIDYDETRFSEEVTRAEFARTVCAVAGYSGAQSNQMFSDVPAESDDAPYINALANLGVMSGFGDGTFQPEQAVSGAEAMTAVVRTLGYVYEAEQAGGYPQGYIHIAQNLRLLNNAHLGAQEAVSREDMALLLFNALEVDLVTLDFENGRPQYVKKQDQNLLLNTFQTRHMKGVVDGVDLTRLRGENDIQPFYLSVDGVEIGMGDIVAQPYLGYQVEAYYTDIDDEYTLIYMEKTAKNNEMRIAFEDINAIGDGVVNAAAGAKNKKYSYDKTAAILYNGVSTSKSFSMDMIQDENGSLLLLDNNGDGTADVVFVEAYTNFVVGDTNPTEFLVYNFLNPGQTIVLDTRVNDPYTVIYNQSGEEISFGGIQQQGVLSIYKSQDDAYQKFIRAYFINDRVTGTITSIRQEDNYVELTIGDRTVRVARDYYEANQDIIKVSQNVKISLDRRGYGVYAQGEKAAGTIQYGFLINVIEADADDDTHEYFLKILSEGGNFERIPLAKKATVDNIKYVAKTGNGELKRHLHTASVQNFAEITVDEGSYLQVIRYKKNKDGEVNMVDTVLNSFTAGDNSDAFAAGDYDHARGENAVYVAPLVKDGKYKQNTKSFNGQIIMEDNAKVFLYPVPTSDIDYTDEKYFDVVTPAYFKHDSTYDVRGYYDVQRKISAPVVAYAGSSGGSIHAETKISIFMNAEQTIDEDDMPVIKVNLMGADGQKSVLCSLDNQYYGEISTMVCGDVFRYSEDSLGYISGYEKIYNIQTRELLKYKDAAFANTVRFAEGTVAAKYEDGVKYDLPLKEGQSQPDKEYFPNADFTYILYDSEAVKDSKRIISGSIQDIRGYEDVGDANGSKVLIQYKWGDPQVIYIIK